MPLDAYDEDWDGVATPSPPKKAKLQVLAQEIIDTPQHIEDLGWTPSNDDEGASPGNNSQDESFIDYEPYLAEALNPNNQSKTTPLNESALQKTSTKEEREKERERLREKRKKQLEDLGWDDIDIKAKDKKETLNFDKTKKSKKKQRFKSISGLGEGIQFEYNPEGSKTKG